jgi:tRNA(His) guanylyltransferase
VSRKSATRFETLGDRMKDFEMLEAGRRLLPGVPVIARLDGRAFHTFTRGMPRPYHEPMSRAMIETARFLVSETHAKFAYTQSDEITLGFWNADSQAEPLFNGRVQKLCSVLASLATAKFNQEVAIRMPGKAAELPVFDARVFTLPSLEEATACVLWRALDCTKNAITMAASAYYSHKALQGKRSAEKHEMLHAKGVNFNDFPAFFKNGTLLRRETFLKELLPEELERIPAKHRPEGAVLRSQVVEADMPPFPKVANLKEVLFEGAAPRLREESANPVERSRTSDVVLYRKIEVDKTYHGGDYNGVGDFVYLPETAAQTHGSLEKAVETELGISARHIICTYEDERYVKNGNDWESVDE